MPFRSGSIAREISRAVAVLAVYVLVLLAPLHQVAGLQHDLAQLGYSSPSTRSICAAALPGDGGDSNSDGITCPIAGIGKQDIVATEPGSVELDSILRIAVRASYPDSPAPSRPTVAPHTGQARAPPMMV